ncbi:MAG: PDZ domain-containing protein [Betaproteobacteria bacterium]|nr:PDZ domain-containing protein [Betaproteobacteria bacterium]
MNTGFRGIVLLVFLAASSAAWAQAKPGEKPRADCVPVGGWVLPGGARLPGAEVVARAAKRSVVLLGERHESAEHHRWQLQMLAALHAIRPEMAIGFEMFPRRVQKALDRWVAGELSEAEFLGASDWRNVWRMDPNLYLPLFHFARMNRIPMVALNIDDRLRREAAARGFDAVPEGEREGVTRPAAPSTAYLDYLLPVYREHEREGSKKPEAGRDDPDFRRFVESQQLWDRAMAQRLHAALARPGRPLVVGIMGGGHIVHGYGVPHQLKDLGVTDVATLLPWDRDRECRELVAGIADAVFGVAAPVSPARPRQRLGIRIELAQDSVRIVEVQKGSIAEAAGIRDGDVITEIAGLAVKRMTDVSDAVQRQAPGTWLPLKVRRQDATVEITAKFPALAP